MRARFSTYQTLSVISATSLFPRSGECGKTIEKLGNFLFYQDESDLKNWRKFKRKQEK